MNVTDDPCSLQNICSKQKMECWKDKLESINRQWELRPIFRHRCQKNHDFTRHDSDFEKEMEFLKIKQKYDILHIFVENICTHLT